VGIITPENKYKYWQILRGANQEFAKKTGRSSPEDFQKWMLENWGIEIGMESAGYTSWFRVVDEKKYLLYLLKYYAD
jgi:hypothetical protein